MPTGHKDPGTIASEIKMMRTEHAGAFLVVEGVTDMRFWRPRKCEECELVDGEGKHNVIGGIRRLDGERIDGVLGIVDDDCDSLMDVDFGTAGVGQAHISSILRSGFTPADLQATTLWTDMRAWEAGNHPFRILQD